MAGFETILGQEHSHAEISRSAEAGHADNLALEIGYVFDLGRGHHIKSNDVGDRAHGDKISAVKPDIDDHLAIGA